MASDSAYESEKDGATPGDQGIHLCKEGKWTYPYLGTVEYLYSSTRKATLTSTSTTSNTTSTSNTYSGGTYYSSAVRRTQGLG